MPVNDEIANALTRHQIGLHRLSNATVRKILAALKQSDARVLERILRDDLTGLSKQRQSKLLRELRRIIDSVYADATGQLHIDIGALASYEVDFQIDMFNRVVPINFEMVRPADDQIVAAVTSRPFQGRLLKDWYKELSEAAFRRLRGAIRMGIIEGQTNDEIVRVIRGTRSTRGVAEVSRKSAETTVRTAINHTANAARSRLYERNKSLIKGVQWLSTLDGRTSPICRARDGLVYEVDKGPRPPAHMNCRSSTAPVLKSWRQMGLQGLPDSTRSSMNGQVAADLTYSDWLRKQPVEFQNDVMGTKKATLFRKGKLSLDRFVDRRGNELTLDELRRHEADAWEKAFP